jgi:hypothetical protein
MPNDGQEVYATMWTLINGQWYYNQYMYQSGPMLGKKPGQRQPGVQRQLTKR